MGAPDDESATFKPVDELPPLPSLAPSAATGPTPFQLSGYEILGELGRGGMAVVYKARQINLNRPVALKMILGGAHMTAEDARFTKEAMLYAPLHHPNIAQIYDIGERDGQPYIAMEFVEGATLADLLDGKPADPRASARLVETLARVMGWVHDRGILHRDLKPSNIMLQMENGGASQAVSGKLQSAIPKIIDFGLARHLHHDSGLTHAGSIMGTPSYMAPEQASANQSQIGYPTDIYALGGILYEMLTGRPPFRAVTPLDTVQQVLHDEPLPPRRLEPGVPLDLETICLKCLAKDPGKRFTNAAALADDLQRFLAGRPILARSTPWHERTLKWVKRRPALAGLLGVAALAALLLVGFAVGAYYNSLLQDSLAETQQQRALARRFHYFGQMNLGQRDWREHQVPSLLRRLEAAPADLRSFEWHYLRGLCHTDLRTYGEHQHAVTCVACSPTENLVASGSGKSTFLGADTEGFGEVRLWDPDSGKLRRQLTGHLREVNAVAFSADGKLLATASSDKTARIWNVQTGAEVFLLKGHGDAVTSVAFAPKGIALATGSRDRTVKIWSVESGKEIRTLEPKHRDAVLSLAFTPDGTQLFSAAGDSHKADPGEIRQWDLAGGKVVETYQGHGGAVTAIAVHPGGKSFASAGDDRNVLVWNVGTRNKVRVSHGHLDRITCLAFDKTGARLASGSDDMTVIVWDPATGEALFSRQGHTEAVRGVAFSADGKGLVSASDDRTVKIWKADGHQEFAMLAGHADSVADVAFSSDGQILTSASLDRTIRIWDAATLTKRGVLTGHADAVRCLAFVPPVNGREQDRQLASGSDDGTIRFWDIVGGKETYCAKASGQQIRALAISPDGARLAYAGVNERDLARPAAITLWDVSAKMGTLAGHASGISSLVFSPDGKRLVSASAGPQGTLKIWDIAAGGEIASIPLPNAAEPRVVISADGRHVAVANGDPDKGEIHILDALSGKERLRLTGHMGMANALAFSPDGERLVTTNGKLGRPSQITLWDVPTGQEVLTLPGPTGLVQCLTFSPDGRRLACGGGPLVQPGPATQRGEIVLWDCGPR